MHDYEFPPEWPAMSAEERDRWFKQERARRQARGQRTAWAERQRTERRRLERRVEARTEVTLDDG